nr:hypothetical protein [Tanacetum cinerariifolium]
MQDKSTDIHEKKIGEDGLIDIDIEIEGGNEEFLNLLWFSLGKAPYFHHTLINKPRCDPLILVDSFTPIEDNIGKAFNKVLLAFNSALIYAFSSTLVGGITTKDFIDAVKDNYCCLSSLKRLSEKGLTVAALRDELRKLKGRALVDNAVTTHTIAPEMLQIDMEPLASRLLNNRIAHSDYIRLTEEQAVILREVVEQGKSQNPLNNSLDSA